MSSRGLGLSCVVLMAGIGACGGSEPTSAAPIASASVAPPAPSETEKPIAVPEPPRPPMAELQKQYITSSAAAWNAQDARTYTSMYTNDAVVATGGPGGWEEKPAAGMEGELGMLFIAFPDAKMTYTRVIQRGDVAVAEWTFTGVNKGDFMGEKATNKPVGHKGVSVLVFAEDGRVKREHMYFDISTMMGQLGKAPKGQKVRNVEATPTAPIEWVLAKEGDEKKIDIVKTFYSASDKMDEKGVLALLTDDMTMSSQYMPADQKRDAFLKDWKSGQKAFPDASTSLTNCVAAGDLVACEGVWKATWKGTYSGMKATGKEGSVHMLDIAKVKDGKIQHVVGYGNGLEFAGTFGLLAPTKADKPSTKPAPKPSDKPSTPHKKGDGGGNGTGGGKGGGGGKGNGQGQKPAATPKN